jgi:hypothetical protein
VLWPRWPKVVEIYSATIFVLIEEDIGSAYGAGGIGSNKRGRNASARLNPLEVIVEVASWVRCVTAAFVPYLAVYIVPLNPVDVTIDTGSPVAVSPKRRHAMQSA